MKLRTTIEVDEDQIIFALREEVQSRLHGPREIWTFSVSHSPVLDMPCPLEVNWIRHDRRSVKPLKSRGNGNHPIPLRSPWGAWEK